MKYPLRGEYETAVRYIDKFVYDSVLKTGKPVKQTQNPNFLRSYNGGKAIVYEIETNQKKYALKCWIEDLGDLKIRYKAIDNYLKTVNLPYFVDFSYNEQGILVNGQKFPIIRMEWIDGISFKQFIANNIKNPGYIRNFAEKFLEMVKVLHQHNISHGDLQHGNIMVRKNGDICLIDYDSLYVPQLNNEKDHIKGLPGYQHPKRNKLIKLSPKSDYFSELIIYLSLLVISEKTSYWGKIEQEERLLFSEKDLVNPRLSPIFAELTKLSPEIQYFTLELEKFCRESDIEALQPLENLVNVYTGSKQSGNNPEIITKLKQQNRNLNNQITELKQQNRNLNNQITKLKQKNRNLNNEYFFLFVCYLVLLVCVGSLAGFIIVDNTNSISQNKTPEPTEYEPKFRTLEKGTIIYKDQELKQVLINSLSTSSEVLIIEEGDKWIKFKIDLYANKSLLNQCNNCAKDEIEIKPNENLSVFPIPQFTEDIFGQLKEQSRFKKLEFSLGLGQDWYKFRFEGYIKK